MKELRQRKKVVGRGKGGRREGSHFELLHHLFPQEKAQSCALEQPGPYETGALSSPAFSFTTEGQNQGAFFPPHPYLASCSQEIDIERVSTSQEQLLNTQCLQHVSGRSPDLTDPHSQGCVTALSYQSACDLMQLPCGCWDTTKTRQK